MRGKSKTQIQEREKDDKKESRKAGPKENGTMFEKTVTDLLDKVLGKYVKGLNRENLQIAVWSGDVTLRDLQLKSTALDLLDIPLSMRFGVLSELSITVPWKNLGKEPIIIRLRGVSTILSPRPVSEVFRLPSLVFAVFPSLTRSSGTKSSRPRESGRERRRRSPGPRRSEERRRTKSNSKVKKKKKKKRKKVSTAADRWTSASLCLSRCGV